MRASPGFAFHSGVREIDEQKLRVVDSGASQHFTSDRSLFHGKRTPASLHIAGISGGLTATSVGVGFLVVSGVRLKLSRLFYVPGLATTLISLSELVEDGCSVSTQKVRGKHAMRITNPAGHTATIIPTNGMYHCPIPPRPASAFITLEGVDVDRTHVGPIPLGDLLPRRLGHQSWASQHFASRIRAATGKPCLGKG